MFTRRISTSVAIWVLSLVLVGACCSKAGACLIDFECITNNDAGNAAIGESQLAMAVTSPRPDQVAFTFSNVGAFRSVITQIYFERGPLADLAAIYDSPGVSFDEGGSPKNLPGGNSISPAFETAFRMSADNPAPHNGVSNGLPLVGDWVSAVFDLADGASYQTVVSQLHSGDLRIGLHVQGFCDGGSEAFVSTTCVPEPATAAMLGVLGGAILLRRQARTQAS